jgi:flagellar hook-length control protein FliK
MDAIALFGAVAPRQSDQAGSFVPGFEALLREANGESPPTARGGPEPPGPPILLLEASWIGKEKQATLEPNAQSNRPDLLSPADEAEVKLLADDPAALELLALLLPQRTDTQAHPILGLPRLGAVGAGDLEVAPPSAVDAEQLVLARSGREFVKPFADLPVLALEPDSAQPAAPVQASGTTASAAPASASPTTSTMAAPANDKIALAAVAPTAPDTSSVAPAQGMAVLAQPEIKPVHMAGVPSVSADQTADLPLQDEVTQLTVHEEVQKSKPSTQAPANAAVLRETEQRARVHQTTAVPTPPIAGDGARAAAIDSDIQTESTTGQPKNEQPTSASAFGSGSDAGSNSGSERSSGYESPTLIQAAQRTEAAAAQAQEIEPLAAGATKRILRTIADQIERLAASRPRRGVTIRLDPKDLGTITLVVKSVGKQISAHLFAENEQVRLALQQSRPELNHALEARGYNLLDVNVGQSGPQQQQQHQAKTPAQAQREPDAPLSDNERHHRLSDMREAVRNQNGMDFWI